MNQPKCAQKVKAGRGWLIARNSATLADTDYERVADEIIRALNSHSRLITVLLRTRAALRANGAPNCEAMKESAALLCELGESE